ncbi:MAG: indole-3-glycerol phosphate synthase TrpC [Desulfobulbaceae bacterium]|nr:indole-3-glycerol phosphate synthase TrpC [Desulfobulbaceae bacterium]
MILDTIVATKHQEVQALKALGLRAPECEIPPTRGFTASIVAADGVALIAEAKKASPSKGVICANFDPVAIAIDYEAGGARAISVLTDEQYFQGSLDYIPRVRAAVSLPVIRKEFIIDEIQIRQAALFGADAILLIAAILDQQQISDFQALAKELGMDSLVEVHDEAEAAKALAAGSLLIGINNRNLQDFTVDLNTTFRVMAELPKEMPVVSESGIRNHHDMAQLARHNVTAALVGESLMRLADRQQGLRDLVNGGKRKSC